MRKIIKGHNSKILSIILIVFLLSNSSLLFSCPVSKYSLRVPVEGHKKVQEVIEAETEVISSRLNPLGADDSNQEWEHTIFDSEINRWQQGVDFNSLFADCPVLVLGDTHHGFLGVQRGLVDRVIDLKNSGVTTIFIEIPSGLNVEDVEAIAQDTRIPHCFQGLVETALSMDVKVVFIDMPDEEKEEGWSREEESLRRGKYMGDFIATEATEILTTEPNARMAVITGYAHMIDYEQIPQKLYKKDIKHRLVALMSQGQPGYSLGGMLLPFVNISPIAAIYRRVEPGKRYGYIDLAGLNIGLDGIICFERPQPRSRNRPVKKIKGSGESSIKLGQYGSMELVKYGTIIRPLSLDFADRVVGYSRWRVTNEEKIAEFVGYLEGLTNGQKIYLTMLLQTYIRTMPKIGSIVDIDFDTEEEVFMFRFVDLANTHGKYDRRIDYGPLERETEIDLGTLVNQFGFAKFLDINLDNLPEVNLTNNPHRPWSIPKIMLLVMAYMEDPELIRVWSEDIHLLSDPWKIGILANEGEKGIHVKDRPYRALLELEDFGLSEFETLLVDIGDFIENDIYLGVGQLCYKDKNGFAQIFSIDKRAGFIEKTKRSIAIIENVRKTLGILLSIRDINLGTEIAHAILFGKVPHGSKVEFYWDAKGDILLARSKLKYLDHSRIDHYLEHLDKIINGQKDFLDLIEKFVSKHPTWLRTVADEDMQLDYARQKDLDNAMEILEKLQEFKRSLLDIS